MQVDILVPVYNAFEYVKRNVDSILGANTELLNKIILSDDNSPEGLIEDLFEGNEYNKVKIVRTPKRSYFSGNVNYGFNFVEAPYFVLMNSDTYVISKDWLEVLLDFYNKTENIGILSPCLTEYPNPQFVHRTDFHHKHLGAISWFMRTELFEKLGKFRTDEKYIHWNSDFDFCDKVIESGLFIGRVPCFVAHRGGASGKPKEVPRY